MVAFFSPLLSAFSGFPPNKWNIQFPIEIIEQFAFSILHVCSKTKNPVNQYPSPPPKKMQTYPSVKKQIQHILSFRTHGLIPHLLKKWPPKKLERLSIGSWDAETLGGFFCWKRWWHKCSGWTNPSENMFVKLESYPQGFGVEN